MTKELTWLEKIGMGVILTPILALLIPLVSMPIMLVDTWVMLRLWRWFIEPIFHIAVPPFWLAMGIGIFASFLISRYAKDERKWKERLMWQILKPLSFLLVGWITHWLAVRP